MWLHGGGYKRLEDWRMYTSVVEKSPGRKIERKQYMVLIEKEVPNLVPADNDFSMPDYSDGWTSKRSSKVVAESLYLHPWPIWQSKEWPAGWESWDHKWSLVTDNLDPTPVGLPTTMSTSILTVIMPPNTSGQLNRGRTLLTISTSLLSWKAWFHHFHTVAEF